MSDENQVTGPFEPEGCKGEAIRTLLAISGVLALALAAICAALGL